MSDLNVIGLNAKRASRIISGMFTDEKNKILNIAAMQIKENRENILRANELDVRAAAENGLKTTLIDRLNLDDKRIDELAETLQKIAVLPDPIGEVVTMRTLPNGLAVGQRRVPIGVIGIIYESRPNVTVDSFGLCLKSGNTVILRGGRDAINTNMAIIEALRLALEDLNYPADAVQLVTDTDRESARQMMRMNEYIDLLIPRGGKSLIQTVVENSTVPVIQTGDGNCHIYVDETAELEKSIKIIVNAKTQRPGVCNACEKLVIHENVAESFLPVIVSELKKYSVQIIGDERVKAIIDEAQLATEEDWYTEYLDYKIGIKIVNNISEAIDHIDKYSSHHSEAILTESYSNAQRFINEIDSAAVYVNASTRFTDGAQFGLGSEIGISTQKLHARGPMGLRELTTTKYIAYGNGQIRA